jgi:uncharacterized protein
VQRPLPDWRADGSRYFRYSEFLRWRFGCRVRKLSLDGAFTCPNVDGTLSDRGCIFCDNRSFSPSRRRPWSQLSDQIEEGIRRLTARYRAEGFLAYFQPSTNTYAPVARLRELYTEAVKHPKVVGLAVGTRPDCVPDDVLDLLAELAEQTYVTVEYGVQTIHDRSLDWLNRQHHYDAFLDAVGRSQARGLSIGAHLIVGLPGETREDHLATAREMARLRIDAVKFHNLYAVTGTRLAEMVASGEVSFPDRAEYVSAVADMLEWLPPACAIERISGDAPPEFLVGPAWCLDRMGVRAALDAELERRDSWQGRRFAELAP